MMLSKKIGTSNNKTLEYISGVALCVLFDRVVIFIIYTFASPSVTRQSVCCEADLYDKTAAFKNRCW